MAADRFTISYPDLAEVLVRHYDIHEGLWGVYLEFGIQGANVNIGPQEGHIIPSAVVPVVKIGIQQFPEVNNLTVDAAKVNPGSTAAKTKNK